MAIIRAARDHNNLPLLAYLNLFFEEHREYYNNEFKRIEKLQPTENLENLLKTVTLQYVHTTMDKIQFYKYDIEIIQECTKLLRFMESEVTMMKLEIKKLLSEDFHTANEIQELLKERNELQKDINKLELEKEYWKVLFRMRNLDFLEEEAEHELKLATGDDDDLPENPSDKVKPILIICEEFLSDSRLDLAEGMVSEKLKAFLSQNKNQTNLDIASLYAMMAKVMLKKNECLLSCDNFKKCLEIREKLLPKDHPDIGLIKYNYSIPLIKNKNYAEAEKLLLSSLEIKEKELGKEHKTIAMIYNLLGKVNDLTNKASNAVKYYNLALDTLDKIGERYDSMYLYISISLCRDYVELQQPNVADTHLNKVFSLIHNRLGLDSTKDTCFVYFKKHLNDATGEVLRSTYGIFDDYDILDLMEIVIKYFKRHPKVVDAIDVWRSLNLQIPK